MFYFLILRRFHFLLLTVFSRARALSFFIHFENDFLMFRMNNFQCSVKQKKKEKKTHSSSHVSSDGCRRCDRFNRVNCIFRAHVWDAADMTIDDIQRVPVFCLFKICLLEEPFMPPLEHWHPFECFQRDLFDRLFPKKSLLAAFATRSEPQQQ